MKPITFNSSLSQKDVYLTMKNLTGAKKEYRFFIGKVWDDGFSVMKHNLFSKHMLNPQFKGVVTKKDNGTEITIKATLNKRDKIGFPIIAGLISIIIIYLIVKAIATASLKPLAPAIVIIIFEALVYLICSIIFTLKAKRIIKFLKKNLT